MGDRHLGNIQDPNGLNAKEDLVLDSHEYRDADARELAWQRHLEYVNAPGHYIGEPRAKAFTTAQLKEMGGWAL